MLGGRDPAAPYPAGDLPVPEVAGKPAERGPNGGKRGMMAPDPDESRPQATRPGARHPTEGNPTVTAPQVLAPFRPPGQSANGQPPAEVRAEVMEITPEIAREWMDRHKQVVEENRIANSGRARDNRPIRWNDVAAYARDMRARNWSINGETIKRATDGTVPDGQHRLYACMQAEVSFRTLVVTGVEPEAQDTIDTGSRRKLSDQLAIANEKNAVVLASVTRWSLRWLHGARGGTAASSGGNGPVFSPTQSEMLEYLAATPRLREAAEFAAHARRQFKSVRASVYAMAWMLFHGADELSAQVFLDGVVHGADLPAGHPALAFRARMVNAAVTGERLSESEQLALLIMAWNAFRDDRPLGKVQLPKGGLTAKNFPEPK
jgi:hypothetical protein